MVPPLFSPFPTFTLRYCTDGRWLVTVPVLPGYPTVHYCAPHPVDTLLLILVRFCLRLLDCLPVVQFPPVRLRWIPRLRLPWRLRWLFWLTTGMAIYPPVVLTTTAGPLDCCDVTRFGFAFPFPFAVPIITHYPFVGCLLPFGWLRFGYWTPFPVVDLPITLHVAYGPRLPVVIADLGLGYTRNVYIYYIWLARFVDLTTHPLVWLIPAYVYSCLRVPTVPFPVDYFTVTLVTLLGCSFYRYCWLSPTLF